MQETPPKKLVVVLGMHRSGTSAVTRSLQALGVDLGEALVPAVEGDNDRGFWEDADTLSINQDIMAALGVSWCPLSPYQWSKIEADQLHKFRQQATELLESKLKDVAAFGIKDPRLTRLLTFWRPVFDELGADVRYVLVVRNPLSVAASLKRRNGFAELRSHLLWLRHVVPSFLDTCGRPRVVVSYERMMADPGTELRRIADGLGVSFDETSRAFADYTGQFLSPELQRTQHTIDDLGGLAGESFDWVKRVYTVLESVASGGSSEDDPEVHALLREAGRYLAGMDDILAYIDRLEDRNEQLKDAVPPDAALRLSDLEVAYAALAEGHAWLESQRDAWEALAAEREKYIAEISASAKKYEEGNTWLESQRQAWELQARAYEQRVAELERQLSEKGSNT